MIGEGGVEAALPFSPAAFHVYVPDADALYEQAVAAGATPLSPPSDQSYGDRMGSVVDAQGITWFIARPA
jgi:PhnB protein